MIYMRIDQIMIMKMIGQREMGLFSAAVRLSEAWYFVPMVITNSLFPAILNAKKTDELEYRRRLVRLFQFMFGISVAVALPISLLSPWLITLLFGQDFAGGAPVLAVHVWTGLFTALGVASSGWFIAENLLKFALLKTLVGAAINILVNFLLIPRFGIMGAAVSTITCQACVSVLFNAFHPRARDIFKLQMQALRLGGWAKTNVK
jgi:PST family polysaccharide transporter